MTIKELIEKLDKYPSDMIVVACDYENGMGEVNNIFEADPTWQIKRYLVRINNPYLKVIEIQFD